MQICQPINVNDFIPICFFFIHFLNLLKFIECLSPSLLIITFTKMQWLNQNLAIDFL